jgi:hypothetical protein
MHALLRFPGGSCNQKVMDLHDRMSLILKHWKTSSNNHSFHDKSSPICIPLGSAKPMTGNTWCFSRIMEK